MRRHQRDNYYVVGEGILRYGEDGQPQCQRPSTAAALRKFRFSRLGPQGESVDAGVLETVAVAMTGAANDPDSADPTIPAGFTYLGQFVDHDLTMDRTGKALGEDVTVAELLQGRSPALDLDSLCGLGPAHPHDRQSYAADGVRLKTGTTAAVSFPDPRTNVDLDGFDLPRVGFGSSKADRRKPAIPDPRNDENLAVAQTHLAFIRFHNRVVDDLPARARRAPCCSRLLGTRSCGTTSGCCAPTCCRAWSTRESSTTSSPTGATSSRSRPRPTIRTATATRSPATRRPCRSSSRSRHTGSATAWCAAPISGTACSTPTAPAAPPRCCSCSRSPARTATFTPGSTVADLDNPESGTLERLPTNWIADFRRLYDFAEAGRATVPAGAGNVAKRTDTLLVDPLADLPLGSFDGRGTDPLAIQRNLAFRNLTRANMVRLASGQQMAQFLDVDALKPEEILAGKDGASLEGVPAERLQDFTTRTPVWFYVLREAELNRGRLNGVGGRIVAEVFHRAMEGSRTSIVLDPVWRPTLGPDSGTFRMVDLLLFAFEGKAELLNPLGEA